MVTKESLRGKLRPVTVTCPCCLEPVALCPGCISVYISIFTRQSVHVQDTSAATSAIALSPYFVFVLSSRRPL